MFFFLDVRFQINFHLKQKVCSAPVRAAKAPGPQIRTLGFVSAIFQTQIQVRAHGWWVGGYVRKGVARAAGVRVWGSFILGLVTPRVTPTIHARKIYMAYFMQCSKQPVSKSFKETHGLREAEGQAQVHMEMLRERARIQIHIYRLAIPLSFKTATNLKEHVGSRMEINELAD